MEQNFNKTTKKDLLNIDPRLIKVVDGFNSRVNFDLEDLCQSIMENGVLNPIAVQQEKDEEGNVFYRLVDGERRYRATMLAIERGSEIARIPALLLPRSMSEEELLIQQLVRNQGKPFSDFEMAQWCYKMVNKVGLTKAEVAKRIGKSAGQVTYWLSILDMQPNVVKLFREEKISFSEYHRIAEAHKDSDGVVNEKTLLDEINKGLENAEKNGKTKMTLKDLDTNGKTIVFRDSKVIKNGLSTLLSYVYKVSEGGDVDINVGIVDILEKLNSGVLIDEILNDCIVKDVS